MNRMIEIIDAMSFAMCNYVNAGNELVGGNNGPYHDAETNLRVSAHWIYTFKYEYIKTGDNKYLEAIRRLADTICSRQEQNKTFICREKEGKDKTNGVIGTAWIMEGLGAAAAICDDESYYRAGVQAFFAQPFNEEIGLWKRRDVDNRIAGYDCTYNHQLWLAAAGAQLCEFKMNDEVQRRVLTFLDRSIHTFQSYPCGLAHHSVIFSRPFIRAVKSKVNYSKQQYLHTLNMPCYRYKEEGYHNFTVFAFAILHHYYPNHHFFSCKRFKRSLSYSLNFSHSIALAINNKHYDGTGMASRCKSECNIFGFSYNSPAFEMPLIVREFASEDHERELSELIKQQIRLNYDPKKLSFCRNTEDEATLNARIYEFVKGIE